MYAEELVKEKYLEVRAAVNKALKDFPLAFNVNEGFEILQVFVRYLLGREARQPHALRIQSRARLHTHQHRRAVHKGADSCLRPPAQRVLYLLHAAQWSEQGPDVAARLRQGMMERAAPAEDAAAVRDLGERLDPSGHDVLGV
jgi:hypothetical protein